jgi:hypothetical protein
MSRGVLLRACRVVGGIMVFVFCFGSGITFGLNPGDFTHFVSAGFFGLGAFAVFWIPSCVVIIAGEEIFASRLRSENTSKRWGFLGVIFLAAVTGDGVGAIVHQRYAPPPR